MSEWISCDDRLPDDLYESFLVYPCPRYSYSDELTAEYRGLEGWFVYWEDTYSQGEERAESITHWQPLPTPPTEAL